MIKPPANSDEAGESDPLSEIVRASTDTLDLTSLRAVRALLLQPEFSDHLEERVLRAHNEPKQRERLIAILRGLKFSFRDQARRRGEHHQQMYALAIGGGSTLFVGTILAAATQVLAFLPLVLLPMAVGIYAAWRGSRDAVRLALETAALNDIVEMLDERIQALQRRKPYE